MEQARNPEASEHLSSSTTPGEEPTALLWEYLEEGAYDYQRPQRGEIREGVVIRKDPHQIIVDIGSKREGVVPATDLAKLGKEFVDRIQVGDEVSVYVLKSESREGDIIVSINMARQMKDWERARQLKESGEIIKGKVVGYNKGGLLIDFGSLQGFVPRSHLVSISSRASSSSRRQDLLSQMVGQSLPLKVIEVNPRQRRLILSERAAWKEWRQVQKERLLENLQEGDVRTGKVTSLTKFGAFVDLGGADGLIHLSELSWDRGKKPEEVLELGQEIQVKVIHIDRERKRIGLSLKRLRPDPWGDIEERYVIGQYVDAEITNLTKFGAFARLEEGVEGLIHISELADAKIEHPSQVVQPGQMVTVQIINLDGERRRVGLSLRRVPEHLRTPFETLEEVAGEPTAAEHEVETVPQPEPPSVETHELAVTSTSEAAEVEVTAEGTEGEVEQTEAEPPPEGETAAEPGTRHEVTPETESALTTPAEEQ